MKEPRFSTGGGTDSKALGREEDLRVVLMAEAEKQLMVREGERARKVESGSHGEERDVKASRGRGWNRLRSCHSANCRRIQKRVYLRSVNYDDLINVLEVDVFNFRFHCQQTKLITRLRFAFMKLSYKLRVPQLVSN